MMVPRTYYTHDNGGRPFKVEVDGSRVTVSREVGADRENISDNTAEDNEPQYRECFRCDATRVWIGESPLIRLTEFSGGHGPAFTGNSILVQTGAGGDRYVFVGDQIFEFTSLAQIEEFVSPVGNNDVPYPWARDVMGNSYLMVESVILSREWQPLHDEPFSHYYQHSLITPHFGLIPTQQPSYPLIRSIVQLQVGSERYAMRYQPLAARNYDRLRQGGDVSVVHVDGTTSALSQDEYVELMEQCGQDRGFQPLHHNVLVERQFY